MTLEARIICVTPLRQNCTLLYNGEGKAVIIDPGGEVERILAELEGLSVEAILLTHGHLDHAGGAASLKHALTVKQGQDVPILGPGREDRFLLKTITLQAASFGIHDMRNVTPDRYLNDGEKLSLLGHVFEVASVPGHTPGHIVFIDRQDSRAIVGDTLFRGTVGRTDFAYGNSKQLLNAIREKLLSLPEQTVILCGHGLPTTIGEEKEKNMYFTSDIAY